MVRSLAIFLLCAACGPSLLLGACGPSTVGTHLDETHVTRGGQAPEPATAPPAPEAAPTLRLGDDVMPSKAAVDLVLDPHADRFSGEVRYELELARPLATLWLHGKDLEVQKAELRLPGGKRVTLQARFEKNGLMALDAPERLPAGHATLTIAYRGHMDLVNLDGIFLNEENGERYAFTQFETSDARRAFPCFDEPRFKIPWTLSLTVPAAMTAAGNTVVASESPADAQGMKRVQFAPTRPLPSYLVAFAVGPFEVIDAGQTSHGAKMRILVPRGRTADADYALQHTEPLLDAVEAYLGLPYPYEKLDLVAVPDFGPGAMENPGLITFKASRLLIRKADLNHQKIRAYTLTTTHELAHQWFGDSVTPRWWDDVWLNESFAEFIENKIVDSLYPAWEIGDLAAYDRYKVMGADSLESARRLRQPIRGNDDLADAFDSISYTKGAAILYMLERSLGDRQLSTTLHNYLTAHADGVASYDDFVAALEATLQRPLRAMLTTFAEQPGVPMISREWTHPDTWTLTQTRLPVIGAAPPETRNWIVPVCPRYGITGSDGRPPCIWLEGGKPQVVGVPMPMKWGFMNAGASGYYHASIDGWEPALASGELTAPERVWLLGEGGYQHGAGVFPSAQFVSLVVALAKDPSRAVMELDIAYAMGLQRRGQPEAVKLAAQALVRKVWGPRARKLGWTPRKGESPTDAYIRPLLLLLVSAYGHDRALGAEARRLADRWIADPHAISPDIVDAVLQAAVMLGDEAFRARLVAAGDALPDHEERRRVYAALARTRDPAQAQKNLMLLLDEKRTVRDTMALVYGAASELEGGKLAWDFVMANWDALVARMPRDMPALFAKLIGMGCSAELRAAGETFFADKIDAWEGGRVLLTRNLEAADRCVAATAVVGPTLDQAILGFRPPGGSPARRP